MFFTVIFLFGQNVKRDNRGQGCFFKKVDVKDVFLFAETFRYRMSKQMMEIKDFFLKR